MPQLCKTGFVRPRCVPLRGRRPRRLTLGFVRRPGPRSFVQGATGRAQLRPESLNRRPADARVTGWSAPAGPGRALWWTNRRMQGTNQCRSRPSGSTLARPHGLSWPSTQRGKVVSWRRAHLHDGPRPTWSLTRTGRIHSRRRSGQPKSPRTTGADHTFVRLLRDHTASVSAQRMATTVNSRQCRPPHAIRSAMEPSLLSRARWRRHYGDGWERA
jgi:hypothetical protein